MKYDSELAVKILKIVEKFSPQNDGVVEVDGVNEEKVSYHIKKLYERGFIQAIRAETFGHNQWLATDLTIAGHEYLKSLEDEKEIDKDKEKMESDRRKVFVVHGRNWDARNALFAFLRSIGLHPLEWSEAVRETGKASPYVGEVLDTAFSIAKAVLVLITPDDEARLFEQYRNEDDEDYERNLTGQARPNVLFEAGMAMGRNPNRTVLIELGKLRPFSDIGGRHVIRINGTPQKRKDLAQRLKTAGCNVNLNGTDWLTDGDFDSVLESLKKKTKISVARTEDESDIKFTPVLEFQCNHSSNNLNEQCGLSINLINEGAKTIRDFRVDVLFPNDFLSQYTQYALEVQDKRTETHRLFRILPSFNGGKPIYPGDKITPRISYEVSAEHKVNKSLRQKVFIDVFVEDNHVSKIEKEMSEFVNYG